MKLFFDTEFTGLKKDTTLVSIGFTTETADKTFYAEMTDYDQSYNENKWFYDNVVRNLYLSGPEYEKTKEMMDENKKESNQLVYYTTEKDLIRAEKLLAHRRVVGDKKAVLSAFLAWLPKGKNIELISDVCHYDMVLFIDLFGTAFDVPSYISPSCHDINQDIASYYNITEKEAFDKSREEIIKDLYGDTYVIPGMKHNALYDARVIQHIYNAIS